MTFTLQWSITEADDELLVREFLYREEISKTALTDIKFKGGSIRVNEQLVNVRYRLKTGDILTIIFPNEEISHGLKGERLPLEIVFKDQYLMVVNKPAGMSTIPSREHPTGSLANAIIGYYEAMNLTATAHIVTRLDRDTSGLVLIAKHRHVHHLLSKEQKNRSIQRVYEAIAHGIITLSDGTIEQPIARKKDSIIERQVDPEGQYACTHYSVIQRYPQFTHLRLKLETGRTHQIRVHLSYIGHPLVGDDLYGGDRVWLNRQALHCKELKFFHPFTKKKLEFAASLPADLQNLLDEKS